MKLDGSVAQNLKLAIASAQRLRGHSVYSDTLAFWQELLHEARRARGVATGVALKTLEDLIQKLEQELAERPPARS